MRFEVRFNNEVWHVFDTVLYKAVEAFRKNQHNEAVSRVAKLNSTPRGPRK